MPKVIYTTEQVTVAMALIKSGFPDSKVVTYTGVSRDTVQELRLDRVKLASAAGRYDADVANRISDIMKAGKIESLRVLAQTFRLAADAIDKEAA